ncbi:hypothetical protein GGX14DRAFT_394838 [Mycena pura]|uniref:Uncharacterized protein n=1 Tax=Mycena pura TaxID=153505 RepID=A0AAD6YHB3_9AGAR|nr:hypothetical protein GGX14DRAFT_394838 [Mycena pura]
MSNHLCFTLLPVPGLGTETIEGCVGSLVPRSLWCHRRILALGKGRNRRISGCTVTMVQDKSRIFSRLSRTCLVVKHHSEEKLEDVVEIIECSLLTEYGRHANIMEQSNVVKADGMADIDGHWHGDSGLQVQLRPGTAVSNQRVEYEQGWSIASGTERIVTTRSERVVK